MILSTRLVLKYRAGKIVLTIPLRLKLTLIGIAFLILFSIIITTPDGAGNLFTPSNTIPLILAGIALLSSAYHECWIFDKDCDSLKYQVGLIFLHKSKYFRLSDLERVELLKFLKGSISGQRIYKKNPFNKPVVTLSILDKSGKIHRLETYKTFDILTIKKTAQSIANYCNIPLMDRMNNNIQA